MSSPLFFNERMTIMLCFDKCKDKLESINAGDIKGKIADIVAGAKIGHMFKKTEQPVIIEETTEEKGKNPIVVILCIIGCIAAVAAIAYAVYHFCIKKPDYLEDFDDDDFDDFDDFDDDEEESAEEGTVTE